MASFVLALSQAQGPLFFNSSTPSHRQTNRCPHSAFRWEWRRWRILAPSATTASGGRQPIGGFPRTESIVPARIVLHSPCDQFEPLQKLSALIGCFRGANRCRPSPSRCWNAVQRYFPICVLFLGRLDSGMVLAGGVRNELCKGLSFLMPTQAGAHPGPETTQGPRPSASIWYGDIMVWALTCEEMGQRKMGHAQAPRSSLTTSSVAVRDII